MDISIIENFGKAICEYVNGISPVMNFLDVIEKTYDFSSKIRKEHFKNNLKKFIEAVDDGTPTKEEQEKFLKKLNNDNKLKYIVSNLIMILESNLFDIKATIYGNIFRDYIKQKITLNQMTEFIEVTLQLFVSDIKDYKSVDFNNRKTNESLKRLSSLGLIEILFATSVDFVGDSTYGYNYTEFGKEYLKYLKELRE